MNGEILKQKEGTAQRTLVLNIDGKEVHLDFDDMDFESSKYDELKEADILDFRGHPKTEDAKKRVLVDYGPEYLDMPTWARVLIKDDEDVQVSLRRYIDEELTRYLQKEAE